ncbi:unnamed protein product, partial [Laminaria digitata]
MNVLIDDGECQTAVGTARVAVFYFLARACMPRVFRLDVTSRTLCVGQGFWHFLDPLLFRLLACGGSRILRCLALPCLALLCVLYSSAVLLLVCVCVFFTLNRSFYPSTSSTPPVRAD